MAINNGTRPRYALLGDDGGEYSADAGDYWHMADSDTLDGMLVRTNHYFRVAHSPRVIPRWRILKSDPSMRDLRRLERASASVAPRANNSQAVQS